jgi:hypothetical protein
MPEISERLHPNSSSRGMRKMARENVVPAPIMMTAIEARRTIQP